MPTIKSKSSNMRLAGVFVLFVFGLIILSIFVKLIFLVKDSNFDGGHKFNIAILGANTTQLVSFSPQNKSISILKMEQKATDNISKQLHIPIDGLISLPSQNIDEKDISSVLLKSSLPFGSFTKDMTFIDALRLFLFTRSVSSNSIYERTLSVGLNEAQKDTVISLTFTDPDIYQENQSIQIVNSTGVFGLGSRLASLITNIGGNVVLVSSEDKMDRRSRIIYSSDETYTVKMLSEFLKFPREKATKRGIADVIIIIGTDKSKDSKF